MTLRFKVGDKVKLASSYINKWPNRYIVVNERNNVGRVVYIEDSGEWDYMVSFSKYYAVNDSDIEFAE